jgi:hypothetical protein
MTRSARLLVVFGLVLGMPSTQVFAQAENARGLDFRSYLSIRKGMTEGEVLSVAGRPDLQAEQGVVLSNQGWTDRGEIVMHSERVALALRTYTYLPTAETPYVTTITFLGGRVSEVQRDRKF